MEVLLYDYGIDDLLSRPYRLRESNGSGTILVQHSRTGGGQTFVIGNERLVPSMYGAAILTMDRGVLNSHRARQT